MATNDYVFVTEWCATGTLEEVYAVLIEGREYVRWWPEVYLEVVQTLAGGEYGLGKEADVYTKGKLPYRLRRHSRSRRRTIRAVTPWRPRGTLSVAANGRFSSRAPR